MPTVENTVTDAAGNAVAGAVIKIDLIAGPVLAQPGYTATTTIGPSLLINADSLGHWSVTLAGNADLTPANTYYRIIEAGYVSYVVVPTSGGPYSPQSLLVAPATPASVAISGVQVATDGVVAGTRPEINLISGAGAGLSAADNPGANRVDVTVTASGGGGGSGTPSTTVVSETSYGQAAVAGSAITYSRGDHTHGSPALTAATPAAETPGATGAAGTATTPARADHVHALPAYGTTAGTFAQGNDSRITGAAQKASNLSDLASPSAARTNLGLGGAATLGVGTTAGTVAAGDDSRIIGALQAASNLSDVALPATARTNLGLGGAATLGVGTTAGTVAAGDDGRITGAAQKASNLSDLVNAATARTNLGVPPSTRLVSAGTGLTGGGDLSADRTLTVSYGTAAGTAAQGNDSRITGALQAANNLSDVANATTARGNLAAAPLASPTFTGTATAPRLILPPVALTDAATVATDASLGNHFRVTLGGNRTLGNPSNPTDGQRVIWELIQDGTGGRTITLDTAFALGTDITAVTLTTTASKRDFLGAVYNATLTKWLVIAFVKGY